MSIRVLPASDSPLRLGGDDSSDRSNTGSTWGKPLHEIVSGKAENDVENQIRGAAYGEGTSYSGEYNIEEMSGYEFRNELDAEEQEQVIDEMVDEDRIDALSAAVDDAGESDWSDHFGAGGKKGLMKIAAMGGLAAGGTVLAAAGLPGAGMAGLSATAVAKGFGGGVLAGAAGSAIKSRIPKDYKSWEGIKKETSKEVSDVAEAVTDPFGSQTDDLTETTAGSDASDNARTRDDVTGDETTDVLSNAEENFEDAPDGETDESTGDENTDDPDEEMETE